MTDKPADQQAVSLLDALRSKPDLVWDGYVGVGGVRIARLNKYVVAIAQDDQTADLLLGVLFHHGLVTHQPNPQGLARYAEQVRQYLGQHN